VTILFTCCSSFTELRTRRSLEGPYEEPTLGETPDIFLHDNTTTTPTLTTTTTTTTSTPTPTPTTNTIVTVHSFRSDIIPYGLEPIPLCKEELVPLGIRSGTMFLDYLIHLGITDLGGYDLECQERWERVLFKTRYRPKSMYLESEPITPDRFNTITESLATNNTFDEKLVPIIPAEQNNTALPPIDIDFSYEELPTLREEETVLVMSNPFDENRLSSSTTIAPCLPAITALCYLAQR
jgi:hypothetical protein